ncbi:MAG TPA: hypothetical protein PK668_20990 [Myxococcota bacterium]|nr:hypothetical protein [Myxococcota bacterium]HRY96611.1 hypothetical protein [Myxococcota bacterium]
MSSKPMGKCPFCHHKVHAKIVEENSWRRDVCRCPECGERILVCRMPGCKDFAEGGETWDEEFCPDCTAAGTGAASTLAMVALSVQVRKSFK